MFLVFPFFVILGGLLNNCLRNEQIVVTRVENMYVHYRANLIFNFNKNGSSVCFAR